MNKIGFLYLLLIHLVTVVVIILFLYKIIPVELLNPFTPYGFVGFVLLIFPFALLIADAKVAFDYLKGVNRNTDSHPVRLSGGKLLAWVTIGVVFCALLFFFLNL